MSISALRFNENIFYRPKGITIATLLMVCIWAIMRWNYSAIVFIMILALFIVGIKKPLWAVAAILVSQMTITSYMVATPLVLISLRLLLMLLTLYIIRGALIRKEIDFGPHVKKLVIPMLILIFIGAVSNTFNGLGLEVIFRAFRNMLFGLLFIIILPAIIEDIKQLKILLGVTFIVAIASSIIGIMQYYNFLGMNVATLEAGFLDGAGRVPGMGQTELELAYILPMVIVIVLSIFIAKTNHSGGRILILVPLIPLSIALYFTYTRSALFALGPAILSLYLFFKTRIRWEAILLIIVLLVLLIEASNLLEETYIAGRSETGQEESSVARNILRQVGIAIALDNPILGIGSDQFVEISREYAYVVNPVFLEYEGDRYYSYTTLGNNQPHHDFITMWLTYGTLALIAYIFIHFVIVYTLGYSFRKSNNRFIKGLSVGLAAALVTYVVNSFYHNIETTLPLLYIIAGFSLVTSKLAARETAAI